MVQSEDWGVSSCIKYIKRHVYKIRKKHVYKNTNYRQIVLEKIELFIRGVCNKNYLRIVRKE